MNIAKSQTVIEKNETVEHHNNGFISKDNNFQDADVDADVDADAEDDTDAEIMPDASIKTTGEDEENYLSDDEKKKKRGRKPKIKTDQPEKIKKRRGRKPKDKFNYNIDVNTNTISIENNFKLTEDVNIIVKLTHITSETLQTIYNNYIMLGIYNPNVNIPESYGNDKNLYNNMKMPTPYDPAIKNIFMLSTDENGNTTAAAPDCNPKETDKQTAEGGAQQNLLTNILGEQPQKKKLKQIDILLMQRTLKNETVNLMQQMIQYNNVEQRPLTSNIKCFWCCNSFDTFPWGIPVQYIGEVFKLYGVFCSPSCALSHIYNYNNNNIIINSQESVSLLHLLYYKLTGEFMQILPAPPKDCLIEYGGQLTIGEYRNKINANTNIYLIKIPPIISIMPVMESVETDTLIYTEKKNTPPANGKLLLKRMNPLNKPKLKL